MKIKNVLEQIDYLIYDANRLKDYIKEANKNKNLELYKCFYFLNCIQDLVGYIKDSICKLGKEDLNLLEEYKEWLQFLMKIKK